MDALDAYNTDGTFSPLKAMQLMQQKIERLQHELQDKNLRIRVLRFAYHREVERNAS